MNKWITCMSLAWGVAVGQTAVAGQFDDRAHSNAWLQDQRSPAHRVGSQANSHDRIMIGGYIDDRHERRQHRRSKHRHSRHTHNRHCEHERGHARRHHRHSRYDDDRRCSDHYRGGRHDRHCYDRPQRRISRVIRAY